MSHAHDCESYGMKRRNPLLAASIAAVLRPDEKAEGDGVASVIQESDGDSEFAGPSPSFLAQATPKTPRPGPASIAKNLMAKLAGGKKTGPARNRRSGLRRK